MPAIVESVTETDQSPEDRQQPDARVLEDRTPDWARMSRRSSGFLAVLGLLLTAVFASRPLWPTDLWDHINYGSWILQNGRIPDREPLLELTDGVPMTASAWLSQTALAALFDTAGFAGLQFACGLIIVASLGLVVRGALRRSGSTLFGFVSLFTFLTVNWHQFLIIRPQLIGVLLYCGLVVWLLCVRRWHRMVWVVVPALFALWANCHGSFSVGLAVLGLAAAGHAVAVAVRTGHVAAAVRSRRAVRLFLLLQLSAAAALIHPAGLNVFTEVVRVGRHPNVATMFEWAPLTLRMQQGQILASVGLLLIVILRFSPRRVRPDEAVLLVFLTGMTLWSSRMINWLAPVLALTLAAHGAAVWRSWHSLRRPWAPERRSGLWTVVNLSLCWVFFALTNFGVQAVHGRSVPVERAVSRQTPVSAVEFLNSQERLPDGLAFCAAEWSGFLMKFGPADFRPMVNLHVHVIPEEVWAHYLELADGPADWSGLADLYGIGLIVADRSRHQHLIRQVERDADWERLYKDVQTCIFRRRVSLHSHSGAPDDPPETESVPASVQRER